MKPNGTMRRIRLRRTLIYLTVLVGLSLFVISLYYREVESRSLLKYGNEGILRTPLGVGPSVVTEAEPAPAPAVANQLSKNIEQKSRWDNTLSDAELADIPKLWFMKDGQVRPERAEVDPTTGRRKANLWPDEDDGDRIVQQLMYVPHDYPSPEDRKNMKLKKILLYNGIHNWKPLREGRESFLSSKCPVDTCEVTVDRSQADTADAILFRDHFIQHSDLNSRPSWNQVWILYLLECPYHTQSFPYKNIFNWTATYRHDSDIVAPYEKFVPYHSATTVRKRPLRNYAANKTKKVAWFVSNCGAQNGRMEYGEMLSKYIDVDIYGACGHHQCPRTDANKCFELLNNNYKFYLSFENSNCKDYITEKFFVNGLGNDVIPIVMGARKEDYQRAAPPHSYIHLEDFASPKELANYLNLLDRNDTLYNEYFLWKGTGELVNTYFWCRVCAMLHDTHPPKVYDDINDWWRGPSTCVNRRWDGKSW